jgi:hypothetical protein
LDIPRAAMALVIESIKDQSMFLFFCDIDEHNVIGPQQEVAVSTRIEYLQDEVSIVISVRNTQLRLLALSTYSIVGLLMISSVVHLFCA